MPDQTKPKFLFVSTAVDKNTFHVVRFKGTEGLSSLYRFEITLISSREDLDLGEILQRSVEFIIKRDEGDISFKGILSAFEQLHQTGGMVFYRAEVVPWLWWSTRTHHNQIFLNKTVPDFLEDVLKGCGAQRGGSYAFKLMLKTYPQWEYICQYNETHFNFLSRWMEHDGLYYFFEQTDQGERLVITDSSIAHVPMAEGTTLTYKPPSSLDNSHREEVVKNFMLRQQSMPEKVVLKDYNCNQPDVELKAEAVVSSRGMGEIYHYGEHFLTQSDGQRLANIRAQTYLCRERQFHGVSTVPYIRAGYIFELKDHYRKDFNQRYLTTDVSHEGSQEAYLTAGLGLRLNKDEDRISYRNSFSCIPAMVQYRSECTTSKPKFVGSMTAKIDAIGSGNYAELDEQGRYKVVLPLDISDPSDGKASAWLRMVQPYAGSNFGMHFPLHKDTEVLLTCIDGDPDRPIIQGAVPNPETPSQVKDTNQTQCCLTSCGQNRIVMEDQKGSERIMLQSPSADAWMRLGAPEPDSASPRTDAKPKGIVAHTDSTLDVSSHDFMQYVDGKELKRVKGSSEENVEGTSIIACLGEKLNLSAGAVTDISLAFDVYSKISSFLLARQVSAIKGSTIDLINAVEKIVENQNELIAQHNLCAAVCHRLVAQQNTLTTSSNTVQGQSAELASEKSCLFGGQELLVAEANTIAAKLSEVLAEQATLIGNMTLTTGSQTNLIGTSSQIMGQENKILEESNSIQVEAALISEYLLLL